MSRIHDNAEFQDRLAFLAERWSQAEIARKTGTQRNNVSRYMHGGKMPLEFAAALVRKLGVNPAWLVVGEGTPFLSDVNTTTQQLAGDLLELVSAMGSVANLQLGSLTGKHHLRVLRELNDALGRFEKLRTGINERTGPLFSQLLDDYWAALERWQLDKAADLRKATEQVARLCDDEKLQERFERTLSFHAFLLRDEEESILYQSRVLQRRLAGAGIDEAGLREVYNLANTIQSVARLDEAISLCDAAVALAGPKGQEWGITKLIRAMSGYIWMERGDVREGLRRVVAANPQSSPAWQALQHSMLIRGLLLSGAIDFAGAVEMKGEGPAHAQGMLVYALWLEKAGEFDRACELYLGHDGRDEFNQYMKAAREVLVHGRKGAARKFLKGYPRPGRKPLNEQFDQAVFGTALARHCSAPDAKKRHRQASKLINGADRRLCMSSLAKAMYYRNVMELGPSNERRAAAEFFRRQLEHGYGCFREIVGELSARQA